MQRVRIQIIDTKGLLVKMSQETSSEINAPDAVSEFEKADVLPDEWRGDHDPRVGIPTDCAILEYAHYFEIPGIVPRGDSCRERAWRGCVNTRWCPVAQGLVGAYEVVVLDEPVQTALLPDEARSRGAGDLGL